jgi:ankyrin repeat protein
MRLYRSILFLLVNMSLSLVFCQQEDTGSVDLSYDNKLIIAADAGDTALVKKLISVGADVDATTWEGVTSLMYATQNNNLVMMKMLIRYGTDTDKKPNNGYTALITAIRNGQPEAVELLIRSGASVDLSDNSKMTPLMHAIAVDSFSLPDMILYYNAAIEPKRRDGMDALMLASWLGRYAVVVDLIELGAEVNAADNSGRTPLHFAAMGGHLEIQKLLIGEGASLEARTLTGYTPLAVAVAKNDFKTSRLLISSGADVNSRISNSLNPLSLAVVNGHDSLTAMLKNNNARVALWPWFSRVSFGGRFTFNRDDMFTGINLGLSDRKYNLWTSLGYAFRPKAIQVLEPAKGNSYFQYWERRHLISFSLDKAFLLSGKKSNFHGGMVAGFEESMTFGSYRGSSLIPETRMVFSPRVGAVLQYGFLRFRVNYAFADLHLSEMSKNWYTLSVELLFNRKKGNLKQNSFY